MLPYHMVLVHDVVQMLLQQREMSSANMAKIDFHQREVDKLKHQIISVFKNASNKSLRLKGGRKWRY